MEWVASTLLTTSEHGVSSITIIATAETHTSAASSRLNLRPCRFKWTRPFHRKTKSGFCACAITFQTQSTYCFSAATVVARKRLDVTLYVCCLSCYIVQYIHTFIELCIFYQSFAFYTLFSLYANQICRRSCGQSAAKLCLTDGTHTHTHTHTHDHSQNQFLITPLHYETL